MRRLIPNVLALIAASLAAPAWAQVAQAPAGPGDAFDGDFLIVAAGVVALPNYEGADETSWLPGAAFAGRIGGVGISPRAAGMALDFVPDRQGAKVSLGLGPVVRLRMNRSGRIKDPVVARLGELRSIVEGGVNLGVTFKRVLNSFDQLSVGTDLRWDMTGRGGGGLIAPSVSYLTPISRAQVIGMLASAEIADQRFASYNYDVTAAGSAASGLPAYAARGGLKALSIGAFTARDLDGDLTNGGLSIGAGAMYTRLTGSAAETPITALRGKASQWFFAAGLGYTF